MTAISLAGGDGKVDSDKDFFDSTKPINVSLAYELDSQEERNLKKVLSDLGFEKDILAQIEVAKVDICTTHEATPGATKVFFDRITFKKKIFTDYTLDGTKPVRKDSQQTQEDFNIEAYFETNLQQYFTKTSHIITFWKSDSKHLINEPINLDIFAADPKSVSIPLMNCFDLAGIADIATEVKALKTNPAKTHNLQERLGEKVTAHIKRVWPSLPVEIIFQIDNSILSFLVEDNNVKYASKTMDQRSGGFKQFISFLLTISAESANKQLSNSLLLLDEPETHLHLQAQEYLKNELIKITKKSNNIVFFATHSNYMIDKGHMDRCYRVAKLENGRTNFETVKGDVSSYSEVNYEVFDIPSNDYHNELYGYLEEVDDVALRSLPKTEVWNNTKTKKSEKVSLPTYIRHSIHHPENTSNPIFTSSKLLKSIKLLRKIRERQKKRNIKE